MVISRCSCAGKGWWAFNTSHAVQNSTEGITKGIVKGRTLKWTPVYDPCCPENPEDYYDNLRDDLHKLLVDPKENCLFYEPLQKTWCPSEVILEVDGIQRRLPEGTYTRLGTKNCENRCREAFPDDATARPACQTMNATASARKLPQVGNRLPSEYEEDGAHQCWRFETPNFVLEELPIVGVAKAINMVVASCVVAVCYFAKGAAE